MLNFELTCPQSSSYIARPGRDVGAQAEVKRGERGEYLPLPITPRASHLAETGLLISFDKYDYHALYHWLRFLWEEPDQDL